MTTFKMPAYLNASYEGDRLFTDAQLKQALRDVLEQAAKLCDPYEPTDTSSDTWDKATELCAEKIRAMIKEIPE
jgi:hypothetical protein